MSTGSKMQEQRYELKYLIEEAKALKVRDYVQSYLALDEFGVGTPDFSYPVHSLYLDSSELKTYWHTINGNKNRFKLRLRYYDEKPNSPIFFEVKRRMNEVILKQRAAVRRSAVKEILGGQIPTAAQLMSKEPDHLMSIQRFVELMSSYNAVPKMHIAYMREAWENPNDNAVRVTMDRVVMSAPNPTATLPVVSAGGAHCVFGKQVILELKFTNRFPNWFRELVETFNVMQGGAAKYAEGIFIKGEDWAHAPLPDKKPAEVLDEFLGETVPVGH
jgi:hypothetical protein